MFFSVCEYRAQSTNKRYVHWWWRVNKINKIHNHFKEFYEELIQFHIWIIISNVILNMNKAYTIENESNFEHAINGFCELKSLFHIFVHSTGLIYQIFIVLWCDDFVVKNDREIISFDLRTNVNLNLNVNDIKKTHLIKAC